VVARFITAVLVLASIHSVSFADSLLSQMIDPVDGRYDVSTYLAENTFGFMPAPIVITDPALEGGAGLVGLFFHESDQAAQKRKQAMSTSEDAARYLIPPSVSALAYGATGNGSRFGGGGHLGFFNEGAIRYMGAMGYGDVNLNFYGFGERNFSQPIEINTRAKIVSQTLKFRVMEIGLFVGIKQSYASAELSPNGNADFGLLPESWDESFKVRVENSLSRQVTTSGFGLTIEYDSRDNLFSPESGYKYSLDYLVYDDVTGSDLDFQIASFEGLNYWQINDKLNTALKVGSEIVNSTSLLPPYALPSLKIRGAPIGRYQGTHTILAEAELGYAMDDRWKVLGFVGSGRAASSLESLKSADNPVSKGLGFRYQIARRYGISSGIDVAFGPEEPVWYIQTGSAW